jgi:hypothetical protein
MTRARELVAVACASEAITNAMAAMEVIKTCELELISEKVVNNTHKPCSDVGVNSQLLQHTQPTSFSRHVVGSSIPQSHLNRVHYGL